MCPSRMSTPCYEYSDTGDVSEMIVLHIACLNVTQSSYQICAQVPQISSILRAARNRTSPAAVGVQFNESVLNRLPGADRSSLGVHHDTGLLHSDNSDGTPFFQYGPGDTITVAINFVTDSILLYKNGLSRGAALVGLPGGGTVYPVVGFDHAEACVAVNLGHKPFRCVHDVTCCLIRFPAWQISATTNEHTDTMSTCSACVMSAISLHGLM